MSILNEPESLIHQQSRLYIMSALAALPEDDTLDFVGLKKITGLTDGNLSVHLSILEQARYVIVDKGYENRKPKTWVKLTSKGRTAFLNYIETLERILRGSLVDKQADNQDKSPACSVSRPHITQHNPFPAGG